MELFYEEKGLDKDGQEVLTKTLVTSKTQALGLKKAAPAVLHRCYHDEKNGRGEARPCTKEDL